jgi:hypothetical protein
LIVIGGLISMLLINPEGDLARFRRRWAATGGEKLSALQS